MPVEQVRLLALLGDPAIDAAVRKHWGSVKPGTPEEKLAEVRRFSNDLRAGTGDAARGKALFAKHCGACHKLFGEGGSVGPGPDQHQPGRHRLAARQHRRSGRRRPDASTCQYAVRTTDGVVRTGIIAEQDGASVTLVDAKGEKTRVPRDRIDSLRELPTSLMPEKLLDAAHPAGAPRPVPLPATAREVAHARRHPPPVPDRRAAGGVAAAAGFSARAAEAEGARRHHPRPGDVRRVPEARHDRVELPQGRPRRGHQASTPSRRRRSSKDRGGLIHFFALGQTLEQADVGWLKDLAAAGHPVGNHTYDHVNVKAAKPEDVQFRFRRAPWLVRNRPVAEVIEDNVATTTLALKERCGITAQGFRTPGGFPDGLKRPAGPPEDAPAAGVHLGQLALPGPQVRHPEAAARRRRVRRHRAAQAAAQPFAYPSGLVEVPMSPISDVTAFRTHYWKLDWFLKAVRLAVEQAIRTGAAFDFLAHPSCLVVEDPTFEAVKLICDLVRDAGDRAAVADLGTIAARARDDP